jgi:hypothetical protein
MQHAAVAATLRDAHLLWKAFDTGQSHLQVTAITIIAAKLLLPLLLLSMSWPAQHSTISLSSLTLALTARSETLAAIARVAAHREHHPSPSCTPQQIRWQAYCPGSSAKRHKSETYSQTLRQIKFSEPATLGFYHPFMLPRLSRLFHSR